MLKVWEFLGEPEVKAAHSKISEFDYNDWTNEIGEQEGDTSFRDLIYLFDKRPAERNVGMEGHRGSSTGPHYPKN